jgi:hypothetical protein
VEAALRQCFSVAIAPSFVHANRASLNDAGGASGVFKRMMFRKSEDARVACYRIVASRESGCDEVPLRNQLRIDDPRCGHHSPVIFREPQAFSGNAIKGPISDTPSGTGNSYVFRHAVPRVGFPYVLAESGR